MELFCHEWKRRSLNSSLGVRNKPASHDCRHLHVDAGNTRDCSTTIVTSYDPLHKEWTWINPRYIY